MALRHLKRQPGYALLNILGLTIGIASALLIILYLNQELSFDKHHEKAKNIYRISASIQEPDDAFKWAVTQPPLGRTVKNELEGVIQFTRLANAGNPIFRLENQTYNTENVYLADSTIFEVFSINLIQGNPAEALDAPNSIVLSKSLAKQIFKDTNPLGQLLETANNSYKVTGVFEDFPPSSHIETDAFISFNTNQGYSNSQSWGGFGLYTYVLLNETASPQEFESLLNQEIIPKYVDVIFSPMGIQVSYELINILDIHLYSDFESEPTALGNIDYIYIFLAIAIFLILVACINYMNLATARSMRRSLEVGLRKVMGAYRGALIRQFIVESLIISLSAILLSLIIVTVVVPIINSNIGTDLVIADLLSSKILLILVGILIFTGIVSGSYPAFYLSAFSPIKAIKGGDGKRTGHIWLRRILVGLQFSVSIFMLLGTMVIYRQMQYVRNVDMGFDKEQVVQFSMNRNIRERWPALRTQLLQSAYITKAGTSTNVPGEGVGKNVTDVETNEGVMETFGVDLYGIDYDYVNVLDLEVVKGRNFSREFPSDTATGVLVNEAMVRRFNWDNPIGKRFQFDQDSTVFHRVIGVIKDFHQQSLYNPIQSLMFFPNQMNPQVLIKIEGNYEAGIAHLQASWEALFPDTPLEYEPLDQTFLLAYEEDQLRGNFFLGFAVMMILISGLGLLGLASFTAEQRSKELSIRKVLGANIKGLIVLLVKDFVWLVLIGAIPAFYIGYQLMNEWLGDFEYHIDISLILFVIVLLIVTAFVIMTTGLQAYRAASMNPSENLKDE